MIKEKELLEDINSYIDQYMSELTKQQAKSILDNLSFIYYKTKSLIIELEGVENSHEKTIILIKNYLEYLKNFKLAYIYITYRIYDYKTFRKRCL